MAEQEPKGSHGPGVDAALVDAVGDAMGRLWKRGVEEAERAARGARERLNHRQLQADLERMYVKLGKETRHLVEAGEVDHPGLKRGVERVRELEARLAQEEPEK